MDYQFENIQKYDQKRNLEFQYKLSSENPLLWGALCLVIVFMNVHSALTGAPERWIFSVVFLALAVHFFFLPYRREKKRAKEYFAFYNGDDSAARVRFGDQILVEDHSAIMTVDYDQIQQVIALKHGCYLRWNDKAYLTIDPKGFTKGTFEEFKQFLRGKCPNAKFSG